MFHPGFKVNTPYNIFLKCHLNCCICRENRTFGILRKRFLKVTVERNSFYQVPSFPQPSHSRKFSTLEEDREPSPWPSHQRKNLKISLIGSVCVSADGRERGQVRVGAMRFVRAETCIDSDTQSQCHSPQALNRIVHFLSSNYTVCTPCNPHC